MASNYGASQVFTGARTIFSIEDQPMAYAADIDGNEEVMYEAIEVLNNLFVQEHAPVGYRVAFNSRMWRVPNSSLRLPNYKGKPFFPTTRNPVESILRAETFVANIQDAATGEITAQIEGVKPATKNFSTSARGTFAEQVAMVGIRMTDEVEVA